MVKWDKKEKSDIEELEKKLEKEEELEDLENLNKFLGNEEIVEIAPNVKLVLESEESPIQNLEEEMSSISIKKNKENEIGKINYERVSEEQEKKYESANDKSKRSEFIFEKQHFRSFQDVSRVSDLRPRVNRDLNSQAPSEDFTISSEERTGFKTREYLSGSEIESRRESIEENKKRKYKIN